MWIGRTRRVCSRLGVEVKKGDGSKETPRGNEVWVGEKAQMVSLIAMGFLVFEGEE